MGSFGLVAAARGEFSVPSSVAAVRVVSIFDEFKKPFGFVFFVLNMDESWDEMYHRNF